MRQQNYKKTLITCYVGFITQAIVANFTPLLFLRFHAEYDIPIGRIALISTLFFMLFGIENWRIAARLWAVVPLTYMLILPPVAFLEFQRVCVRSVHALYVKRI